MARSVKQVTVEERSSPGEISDAVSVVYQALEKLDPKSRRRTLDAVDALFGGNVEGDDE